MVILLIVFVITVMLGIPVAFCLGLAALIFLLITQEYSLMTIPTLMFAGIDSFPLMAIPFFVMVGFLAESAGVLPRLVEFAKSIVGRLPGGLAQVNIIASMFFAGVTGVAVADTAAIGSLLIPPMIKEGYPKGFTGVVTSASSVMGPIIPPSVAMIIYAYVGGGDVSIITLFLAGATPGILIGLGMMGIVHVISLRQHYPISEKRYNLMEILAKMKSATLGLIIPFIILGGILGGIFTPTEAGAVAVAYILFVGILVTRTLTLRVIMKCLLRCFITSSAIFMLLATSRIVAWILVSHQIPAKAGNLLMSITADPMLFLVITLTFLLAIGFFIEAVATMIMLVPVLAPIAATYGIDPHHFGLLFVMTVQIALITPPVALGLFIVCRLADCNIEEFFKDIWPFLFWIFAVILLVAFFPEIALWLPRLLGH